MAEVTISKGVVLGYLQALLNEANSGVNGETFSEQEWEAIREKLYRVQHYLNQPETK